MAKRGYKLQEFVAHSGNVNCLSIGKKTSRLLLTGGDDYKVNLWSIGKTTSPMVSFTFLSFFNLFILAGLHLQFLIWFQDLPLIAITTVISANVYENVKIVVPLGIKHVTSCFSS
jgi:hypothetical protein